MQLQVFSLIVLTNAFKNSLLSSYLSPQGFFFKFYLASVTYWHALINYEKSYAYIQKPIKG